LVGTTTRQPWLAYGIDKQNADQRFSDNDILHNIVFAVRECQDLAIVSHEQNLDGHT